MRRATLLVLGGVAACVAAVVPSEPIRAHGGTDVDVTSDYRTRITDVTNVDGLQARTIGLDGIIEVTWTGSGSLVVSGYQGEPYLRFDDTGVARNARSPTTYLNEDRYANVDLPASADADAQPDWEPVTSSATYQWHDHRTHWMSSSPPPQVSRDDNSAHVIYERWEIPLVIDGRAAVIAGDLVWAPPPSPTPWIALSVAVALAAGLALWSRWWRPAAALLAALGTATLVVDTLGYVALIDDTVANQLWAFNFAVLALAATLRLAVHASRRTAEPTLAMMLAGLVLVVIGGLDRIDVFTSGFYLSSFPAALGRLTTAISLGIGAGLIARFLAFLVPLLVRSPTPQSTSAELVTRPADPM